MEESPGREGGQRANPPEGSDSASTSFLRRNWSLFKNWLIFVVILGVFVGIDQQFNIWINTTLTEWTGEVTSWFLRLFGLSSRMNGRALWSNICAFEIIGECTAYYPVAIYVAAVGAFPARFTRRLVGILLGVPIVLLINQARLVSLCYVYHWIPEYFETIHIVVWQSLIIILTVVLWLVWATTLAGNHDTRST